MKTLVRVDTARGQKDRHFSRAREGDVACEAEARQQSAKNVAEAKGAEVAAMSMTDELDRLKSRAIGRYISRTPKRYSSTCDKAEQCCGCPKRPPTLCCSRAVAGRNDEIRKIDVSHCGTQ